MGGSASKTPEVGDGNSSGAKAIASSHLVEFHLKSVSPEVALLIVFVMGTFAVLFIWRHLHQTRTNRRMMDTDARFEKLQQTLELGFARHDDKDTFKRVI